MKTINYIAIGAISLLAMTGCDNSNDAGASVSADTVPVSFTSLSGDPSTQELKTAELCLSKFATKLEKDLKAGMESAGYKVDIFNILAHKIFTDSTGKVNVQYSISGMNVLPSGGKQMMDDKKQMINCASQGV